MSDCKCENDPGEYYSFYESGCEDKIPEDANKYKIAVDDNCVNMCELGGYENYKSTVRDNTLERKDYNRLCGLSINKIDFPDDIKNFLEILITTALNINKPNNLIELLIPEHLKAIYYDEINRVSDNTFLCAVSTNKLHLGNILGKKPLFDFLAGLLNIFGAVIYNILYTIENQCNIFESLFELIFDYNCSMAAINNVSDCLKTFSNFDIPENSVFIKMSEINFKESDITFFLDIYYRNISDICIIINTKIQNGDLYNSLSKFKENEEFQKFILTIGTSQSPGTNLLDIHKDLDLYLILLVYHMDIDKVRLYLNDINLDLYTNFSDHVSRTALLGGARKHYYSNKITKYQEKIKKLKF